MEETAIPISTTSSSGTANATAEEAKITSNTTPSKATLQLKKLSEANTKYKNLLKLAKERIQKQEEEISEIRREKDELEKAYRREEADAAKSMTIGDEGEEGPTNIVKVCQCIKNLSNGHEEIWALLEMETINEVTDAHKRFKEWKRFDTQSELQDFVRRDTGEPLTLPPYSLSADESAKLQEDARTQIASITEEFRRFRVRAELARKQADTQIRELQSNNVQRATKQIEKNEAVLVHESDRSAGAQIERMKAEIAAQEAHWKEAYDLLLAENKQLKSEGSESLLASQWRHRYEACLKEKDELQAKLNDKNGGEDVYEQKYRDLKESFRLYRRKAKEMFGSQGISMGSPVTSAPPATGHLDVAMISHSSSSDAKISYLKNLMVNYLTSDHDVQDHMVPAIATVLQFTDDDLNRIKKKKASSEAWFYS